MNFSSFIKLTRLNQPIGIFLLFLPCLFGIIIALKQAQNIDITEIFRLIFLFFLGSIIMRSAGCIINDLLDHKFDKAVTRTKNRPLVTGEVSKHQALTLLLCLLSCALVILLKFNLTTIISGFLALIMVVTYPLMKRITYYPQVFLGLTFNFGIIMSSLAINEKISLATLTIYLFSIIWTVIYDTFYAYQDIEDDLKIGVKSTAIKFSRNPQRILSTLNFIMFLIMIFLGWHEKFSAQFFLAILLADMFLQSKINKCDFSDSVQCLKIFKSNLWFGTIIILALILA